jgi:hypothetical protein
MLDEQPQKQHASAAARDGQTGGSVLLDAAQRNKESRKKQRLESFGQLNMKKGQSTSKEKVAPNGNETGLLSKSALKNRKRAAKRAAKRVAAAQQ